MGLTQSAPSEEKVKETMKNRWANLPSNIPPQTSQTSSVPQKENNPPKQPPATSNSQPKPISEPIKKEPVKPIEETTKKIIEEKPIIKKEEKKVIDPKVIENNLIAKVFQISLDENKSTYFEFYKAYLLSSERELRFEIQGLDELLLNIIQNSKYKDNIIPYLFECYHRVFQLEHNSDAIQIQSYISTYLGQLIASPSNFGLSFPQETISKAILEYYENTDENELLSLLNNFIVSSDNDEQTLSLVFGYLFYIMNTQNKVNQTFYKCDTIRKNISILTELFEKSKIVIKIYANNPSFLPSNTPGNLIQMYSFLGSYINLVPFEVDQNVLKLNYPKQLVENDASVKSFMSKYNNLVLNVSTMFAYFLNDTTDERFFGFCYEIIKANFEYTKTYPNLMTTCSIGFLMNLFTITTKLFFDECKLLLKSENFDLKSINCLSNIVKHINILFSNTNDGILFNKFDLVNSEKAKEYKEKNLQKSQEAKYNRITKLYFISQCLQFYFLGTLEKRYTEILKQMNTIISTRSFNSDIARPTICLWKAFDVYIKNPTFIKSMTNLNQISILLLLMLNNSKYNYESKDSFDDFYDDFYHYITIENNEELSSLPSFIVDNITQSFTFIRNFSTELYYKDSSLIKLLIHFSILYSSKLELIHNPYLRSQIFDVMLYTFLDNSQEKYKNQIQSITSRLLKDEFINDNLINSIMRVFIDAERVGTANQFYEKFSIRNKVLILTDNLFSRHEEEFKNKILNYAQKNEFETTKMLTLLLNDVNYLIDEVITRFSDIKTYQDLKDDTEKWNAMSEEEKSSEDGKFAENDRLVKPEIKMLNSSLKFLVTMCSYLQKYFLRLKLAERLAVSLNYCLNQFTSKSSNLKIKNKAEYEFSPSLILVSLIKIYICFIEYEEFLQFVVTDEANYKYDNFLLALKIKNSKSKVKVDYITSEQFDNFVDNVLKKAEEKFKKETISYDDAPEEFVDPITAELMNDPVILPSSKVVVDRTTIETQLINDPVDPYNRSPLKKEDLIPNEELKKKIEEYKEKKMAEAKKSDSK